MRRVTLCLFLGIAACACMAVAAGAQDVGAAPGFVAAAAERFSAEHPETAFYHTGSRITRIYGAAFGSGTSAIETAEAFRTDYAGLFGVAPDELEPVSLLTDGRHTRGLMYDRRTGEYKFTLVYYSQYKGGFPVFRSDLRLVVLSEPGYPLAMAAVNLRDLGGFSATVSEVNADAGIQSAIEAFPSMANFTEPEVVIWAGVEDVDVEPAVAVTFIGDNYDTPRAEKPLKWRFVTHAATGEILYQEDMIIFADVTGNVSGRATVGWPADFCAPVATEAMPYARLNIGTTVVFGDLNGNFVFPNAGTSPVDVESRMWGQWFRVFNKSGPDTMLRRTVTPPDVINFLYNTQINNEHQRAEVNGYLHANIVRDYTLAYNPLYPNLQQNDFPVYVNELEGVGYCPRNAWYDGSSITFCRAYAPDNAPNTAWSTVVHHEYGHHLVSMAGSGQGEYGEGSGDVIGVLITDTPETGIGFFGTCGSPLRTADNTCQYLTSGCSTCGSAIHSCGQLLSGCVWSTRNALLITNPTTYRDILSNLAINAMLLHSGSGITPQITIDYLTLDDDDANLLNGTPHYFEIDAGFSAHGMPAPPIQLIGFQYPSGLPGLVTPNQQTTVRVDVVPISGTPVQGTGTLTYRVAGGAFTTVPMAEPTANQYDATLPGANCLESIDYYFSAQDAGGLTITDPTNAPTDTYSVIAADSISVAMSDNFETNQGWTAVNLGASSGFWQRGVPVNDPGWQYDPIADSDGSGQCFLTQNQAGNTDVDDGAVQLSSPIIDMSGGAVNIEYDYYLFLTDSSTDRLLVEINNNGGTGSWIEIARHDTDGGTTWRHHIISHSDLAAAGVTLTANMQLRFTANDSNPQSIVESGLDAFVVTAFGCQSPCPPATGDMNEDFVVNGLDIKVFCDAILGTPTPEQTCAGDFDGGGDLGITDISGFVTALLTQ